MTDTPKQPFTPVPSVRGRESGLRKEKSAGEFLKGLPQQSERYDNSQFHHRNLRCIDSGGALRDESWRDVARANHVDARGHE